MRETDLRNQRLHAYTPSVDGIGPRVPSSDGEDRAGGRRSRPSWWGRTKPAMAPSQPLYEVLEEEFHQLHGDSKVELPRLDFDERQLVDLPDLARRLCFAAVRAETLVRPRPSDEVSKYIVRFNPDPKDQSEFAALLTHYMRHPGRQDDVAHDVAARIVARLNQLVASSCRLQEQPCFARLDVNAYVEDLRRREKLSDDEQQLLNRLLLEAAYPSQLAQLRDRRLASIFESIRSQRHAALCLSGGGIRSASFGLGVLQGLARWKLLRRFDYLSTVSGGGYLGGWLTAWMTHAGPEHVYEALARAPKAALEPEPAPIRHLRSYSNYLSPRLGLFSVDTWTLGATYIRNVLLNWLVLLPPIAAALLIPRLWLSIAQTAPADWIWVARPNVLLGILLVIGVLLGSIAVAYAHGNRPDKHLPGDANARRARGTQLTFVQLCLAPLVLSALFLTVTWELWWQWQGAPDAPALAAAPDVNATVFAIVGAALHAIGWGIAAVVGVVGGYRRSMGWPKRIALGAAEVVVIIVTGALAGWLAYQIALALEQVPPAMGQARFYVIVAVPAFLGLILLGGQLFLGILSRWTKDPEREWGARFNAWIFMVMVIWLAMSLIVLVGPSLVDEAYRRIALLGVGAVSGVATILLGGSAKTPGKQSRRTDNAPAREGVAAALRKYGLTLAAPIFALSILIALSALGALLLRLACLVQPQGCHGDITPLGALATAESAVPLTVLVVGVGLIGVGLAAGGLIDTNKFSLHAMYRARLIRAFLGASRAAEERAPNRFTGFDENDELYMPELWPSVEAIVPGVAQAPNGSARPPLHVTNLTLNLVAGDNPAWQERKAESFTVTPLHAGSLFVGYRRTSPPQPHQAIRMYGGDNAISLGTAITISGAAASPNAGYHSSSVVTFLMTLFNARLGWWLGNPGPRGDKTYHRMAPRLTVRSIFAELFGLTNDRSPYVYLSDGGHFDNLGLYEMVLRRNRFIVVSDASGDPMCSFEDLGNAVRKIRIDLGIPIEFPRELAIYPRTREDKRDTGRYWAIGRIRYSVVDRKGPESEHNKDEDFDGILVYIKPAFYGLKEPRDVYNYAKVNIAFPHESTTDQFFSESQFESYRALGAYIVDQVCQQVQMDDIVPAVPPKPVDLDWLAYRIKHFDDPPATASDGSR